MDFFIDWLPVVMLSVPFSRTQLLFPEYDPIASGDICLPGLRRRYEGRIWINHTAAIRGVLLKEDGRQFWIWGCGLLHDEMPTAHGHERPLARYRNQYGMLARVEFETGSNMFLPPGNLQSSNPEAPRSH